MTRTTRMSLPRLAAITGVLALGLAGCGAAPDEAGSNGDAEAPDFQAAMVADLGGFDDRSFNQSSYEGAQAAVKELGAKKLIAIETNAVSDIAGNLQSVVDQNADAIVAVGFNASAPTIESALANPDIDYVILDDAADADGDGKPDAPNIKPLLYDTAQAAFLAGYLSAGFSEVGKVGTFGGMQIPTVTIFMDGFYQGVQQYNKDNNASVEVVGWDGNTGVFTGGFDNNQDARNAADNVIGQGVDVILPVGGPIYQAALASIQDSGRDIALIGVDKDFFFSDEATQPYVLTSILKDMTNGTKDVLLQSARGTFDPSNAYIGTLENGGVGLAPFHNFEDKVPAELAQKVDDLKAKIVSGELTVTSYLAE